MGFFGTFATGGRFALAPLYAGCGTYLISSGPQAPRAKLPATRKANPQVERGDISDILRASSKLPGTVVCVLPILQEQDGLAARENALVRRAGKSPPRPRRSMGRVAGVAFAPVNRAILGGWRAASS